MTFISIFFHNNAHKDTEKIWIVQVWIRFCMVLDDIRGY